MSTEGKTAVTITETSLPETETLRFLSRGKVRDLYEIKDKDVKDGGEGSGDGYLLFVATDRISAFDVILKNVCAFFFAFECMLTLIRSTLFFFLCSLRAHTLSERKRPKNA